MGNYYQDQLKMRQDIKDLIEGRAEDPNPISMEELEFYVESKHPVSIKSLRHWISRLEELGFIKQEGEGYRWNKTPGKKKVSE